MCWRVDPRGRLVHRLEAPRVLSQALGVLLSQVTDDVEAVRHTAIVGLVALRPREQTCLRPDERQIRRQQRLGTFAP